MILAAQWMEFFSDEGEGQVALEWVVVRSNMYAVMVGSCSQQLIVDGSGSQSCINQTPHHIKFFYPITSRGQCGVWSRTNIRNVIHAVSLLWYLCTTPGSMERNNSSACTDVLLLTKTADWALFEVCMG